MSATARLTLLVPFLLALVFLVSPSAALADNICSPDASWGSINKSYEAQILTLTSNYRASLGLSTLTSDPALDASAEWKSANMAGLNYFAHSDDPINRSVASRLNDCGYPQNNGWGENIAYGYHTPDDVFAAWLASPGHKANIENPTYRYLGVGAVAATNGSVYWTQDFGTGPSHASSLAPAVPAPPAPVTQVLPPVAPQPTSPTQAPSPIIPTPAVTPSIPVVVSTPSIPTAPPVIATQVTPPAAATPVTPPQTLAPSAEVVRHSPTSRSLPSQKKHRTSPSRKRVSRFASHKRH